MLLCAPRPASAQQSRKRFRTALAARLMSCTGSLALQGPVDVVEPAVKGEDHHGDVANPPAGWRMQGCGWVGVWVGGKRGQGGGGMCVFVGGWVVCVGGGGWGGGGGGRGVNVSCSVTKVE